MKRSAAKASNANPSTVLAAFVPETEFTMSLDGWILLETLGSPLVSGEKPGMKDIVLAALVMTDEDAVFAAMRKGRSAVEAMVAAATAGKRPADALPLVGRVQAAIASAFSPLNSGADPSDEKKSSAGWAGG